MKTFVTAVLVCVAFNSHAQVPDKTSDTQVIGRNEAVSVSIIKDTVVGTLLQISITQPDKDVNPTFGDRTLKESGNRPSSAESVNKPITTEDVKVRLFASNGEEFTVTALDPKGSFFGSTGVGSINWSVRFKVTGANLAIVDRAEVQYGGTRLIFKIRDYLPLSGNGPRKTQSNGSVNDAATALEIAQEYFQSKVNPKGPEALGFKNPQAKLYEDARFKQWMVSWSASAGPSIVIVVDAKTGEAYQADMGTD